MSAPYSEAASFVNPAPTPRPYLVSIRSGYTEFRAPKSNPARHAPISRGIRKKITCFSPSSRRNFLKRIFSLNILPSLFLTLTYPRYYPADALTWKWHLDNFSLALLRAFPGAWLYWKLEPQKRGAPHFHLCGDLGRKIPIALLRRFVAKTWFRVVGIGYPEHLRAGTQADYVNNSHSRIKGYVCKYVAKSTASALPEWATPGRFWGIIGRKNLPASPCCHVLLTRDIFFKLRRFVRKWIGRSSSPSSGNYAKRLKKLPSFFILAHYHHILRQLEFILGFSLAIDTLSQSLFDFYKPVPF